MKTLQEIKNHYAQELGHEDWKTFLNYYGGRHPEWFEQYYTEICIRAQKAYYIQQITELIEDLQGIHPEYILERLQEEIEPTPKI